jgi:ubiquitin-like modifier-activating enzyme ATG7
MHAQLRSQTSPLPYFLVREDASRNVSIAPVEQYESFFASTPPEKQTIAFLDPSADPSNPGWPLRNLLAYLRALYPETTSKLRVLRWRDTEVPASPNVPWKSQIGTLTVAATAVDPASGRPSAVGWEKNPQGKLGPRVADLAPMMDPTRYVFILRIGYGIKLIRWGR